MVVVEPSIVIVAKRGPNDFVWRDGKWAVRKASGALVSLLQPLARRPNVVWYCCVSGPPDARQARQGLFTTAADQTEPRLHVVPVPLPAEIYHAYYGRISNEVLWMLQHHVIGPGGYDLVDQDDHRAFKEGYLEANRRLAVAISRSQSTPHPFLVQDYHLDPIPALPQRNLP